MKPKYAVISSGRSSRYCHPNASVVGRLNEALGEPYSGTVLVSAEGAACGWFEAPRSARLWVTAMDGDVTLVTNGDGVFARE